MLLKCHLLFLIKYVILKTSCYNDIIEWKKCVLQQCISLVIPNPATLLCLADRVWKGILEKHLLSRGGSLSEV